MEGKVIAITGGASGIGLSLATLLAKRGAKLSIADVSQHSLDKAAETLKEASGAEHVTTHRVDVRDYSQVEGWLKATVEKFGKLDGAANLAGIFGLGSLEEMEAEQWDRIIGVNVTGVMHSLKAELRIMTGGSIVNAASIAGLQGSTNAGAYCTSKHAVIGLTRVAAKEAAAKGIRVNAVAPGMIDTPMLDQLEAMSSKESLQKTMDALPIKRKARAEEVANVIAFLLSEDSSFVTGAIYSVDGGINV